jgi:hypothetical protein
MKRSLDDWVVRGAPVASEPVGPSQAAVDAAHVLNAGATHVEADGTRVVADKPAPKKKRSHQSKGLYFSKTVAGRTAIPKPAHTPMFAEFIDVGMSATGDSAFEYAKRGTPLAGKSTALRGAIAEAVVKKVLTEMGKDVRAPEGSDRVDGTARGEGCERYDLLVDDAKVEVKNGRMVYAPSAQRWLLQFAAVKKSEFDRLVLCFEGFDGVRVYEWGGGGYGTNGQREAASGGQVQVYASMSESDALAAHAQIVTKMEEKGNALLKFVPYADPAYADTWATRTRTDKYYEGVPLAALSPCARGNALEAVVRAFVTTHLGHTTADAPVTQRVNGGSRGKYSTSCDFFVDGKRAEVKSCTMNWVKKKKLFALQFCAVKPDKHDVLYLAWMTPRGVHIFEHDGKAGLCAHGKATEATGYNIQFSAPAGKNGYTVPAAAERFLLKNLHWLKLPYLGFLAFQPGDAERVMERGALLAGAGVEEQEEEEEEEEDEGDAEDESEDA